ncbi:MAG: biotin transport system substrate-specific component [Candidatus Poseidoniaceae archaeon]|jgi:biotin transport system substrate-specific component
MFNQLNVKKPAQWHLALSNKESNLNERVITIVFFAGLTALCAQVAFTMPWSPVPYTLQTFAVLATGVYLRRNDAFASGCLYLIAGALGAPIFAEGGDMLFSGSTLIASGGYLLAFPFASAIVAEGLDRSRKSGVADLKAQIICWSMAMIPVYVFGTAWLAHSYSVDFAQAYAWGVEPFLVWDIAKIVVMALVTTLLWSYSSFDEELGEDDSDERPPTQIV